MYFLMYTHGADVFLDKMEPNDKEQQPTKVLGNVLQAEF
jgi:hypothetical protein